MLFFIVIIGIIKNNIIVTIIIITTNNIVTSCTSTITMNIANHVLLNDPIKYLILKAIDGNGNSIGGDNICTGTFVADTTATTCTYSYIVLFI